MQEILIKINTICVKMIEKVLKISVILRHDKSKTI